MAINATPVQLLLIAGSRFAGCVRGPVLPAVRVYEIAEHEAACWSGIPSIRTMKTSAQGLAEYALILALIAIAALVALKFLGGAIVKILQNIGKQV